MLGIIIEIMNSSKLEEILDKRINIIILYIFAYVMMYLLYKS